jgi:hypothetical protein
MNIESSKNESQQGKGVSVSDIHCDVSVLYSPERPKHPRHPNILDCLPPALRRMLWNRYSLNFAMNLQSHSFSSLRILFHLETLTFLRAVESWLYVKLTLHKRPSRWSPMWYWRFTSHSKRSQPTSNFEGLKAVCSQIISRESGCKASCQNRQLQVFKVKSIAGVNHEDLLE